MKLRTCIAVSLMWVLSLSAEAPRGTVPRATADRYPAHATQSQVSIGVTLLTADQVRKAFVSDVTRCCLVVEVALYPPKDSTVGVSLNDFALRVTGTDIATKPSGAKVLAAKLQKRPHPPMIAISTYRLPQALDMSLAAMIQLPASGAEEAFTLPLA